MIFTTPGTVPALFYLLNCFIPKPLNLSTIKGDVMFSGLKQFISGAQILFVAFGALVLVPLLTGLNPAMALLGAGVGTLMFQLCTDRKVPLFLGSSFAFIGPIIFSMHTWGQAATQFGLFCAGVMYFVVAGLIRMKGMGIINRLLPPVVIGPVIMVIGLSVAVTASGMAMGQGGGKQLVAYWPSLMLATVSLATTIIVSVFAGGLLRLVLSCPALSSAISWRRSWAWSTLPASPLHRGLRCRRWFRRW